MPAVDAIVRHMSTLAIGRSRPLTKSVTLVPCPAVASFCFAMLQPRFHARGRRRVHDVRAGELHRKAALPVSFSASFVALPSCSFKSPYPKMFSALSAFLFRCRPPAQPRLHARSREGGPDVRAGELILRFFLAQSPDLASLYTGSPLAFCSRPGGVPLAIASFSGLGLLIVAQPSVHARKRCRDSDVRAGELPTLIVLVSKSSTSFVSMKMYCASLNQSPRMSLPTSTICAIGASSAPPSLHARARNSGLDVRAGEPCTCHYPVGLVALAWMIGTPFPPRVRALLMVIAGVHCPDWLATSRPRMHAQAAGCRPDVRAGEITVVVSFGISAVPLLDHVAIFRSLLTRRSVG